MNSRNPAYYEALAAARGVRPAPARSWSILLTSANHGTVGPLGSTFPHAGEHHERVVVVEVPASAGAPSDQVNLVLRAAPAAQAKTGASTSLSNERIDELWDETPTADAETFNEVRRRFARAIEREVAAQAGQVAVPGWQPIETVPGDMSSRLYLVEGFCLQGFVDAAGDLMVQSEVSPHWRKMRGKPTHWMPLSPSPVKESK